jgi:hypothetical protein
MEILHKYGIRILKEVYEWSKRISVQLQCIAILWFIQLSIKKKVQKDIWISYGYNLILI